MVSQSSYGSITWFLNQNLVNYMFPNQTSASTDSSKCASTTEASKVHKQMMVSSYWFRMLGSGWNHHMVPLYGFSIIIWFHYMVSQSKNGFPKYGFSIKIW